MIGEDKMSDNISLLKLIPERPVVRNDQVSEFDLVVEINTVASQDKPLDTPKDLNLCVVIDRSGSMGGAKLETAKNSCKAILQRLSSKDRFSLVVFDDEAQVIVNPATSRDQIFGKIESIKTGGQTNLALGWHLGLLELQTYTTDTHINRLILLSDGQANQGQTKASVLGSESDKARSLGITTSTIGIGNDFQEDILAALANESGGRFYYIQESKIEDILDDEFQGSLSTQIERPRIALEFPEGIKVVEELNDLRKIAGKYSVRPILSNDVFCFAIRVEVDPMKLQSKEIVLKASLYEGTQEFRVVEEKIILGSYGEFVTSEENLMVRNIVQQYKTAKTEEKMIEQIDKGDFDLMKMLLVENVGDMLVVKDKLLEKYQVIAEFEQMQTAVQMAFEDNYQMHGSMRGYGDIKEDLYKSDFMLIFVDFITYIKSLVENEDMNNSMHSFLARWRKLLVQDRIEIRQQQGWERRMKQHKKHGRAFDDSQQRELLENAQAMIDELLLRYPIDNQLQLLKVRIHEQLERH